MHGAKVKIANQVFLENRHASSYEALLFLEGKKELRVLSSEDDCYLK
jgi:hypothetical protein